MVESLDPFTGTRVGAAEAAGLIAGYQRFPGVYRRPPWILDTTQVMNELKSMCRAGFAVGGVIRPTTLRHSPLVASRHVYTEMYRDDGFGHANKFEKLAQQSTDEGWPTESRVFRDVFASRLLPLIRFVEVGDMFEGHAVVLSVGSRKDVPTAQLALLLALARPVVLSRDSHLNRPGLASVNPDAILRVAGTIEFAEFSVYAAGYASVGAARRLTELVNYAAGKLGIAPKFVWAGVGVLAGVGAIYGLRTPERRAMVTKLIQPVAGLYMTVVREGANAQAQLASLPVPITTPSRLEQRLAHALLDGSRRDVAALSQAISVPGVEDDVAEQTVLRGLEELPCFVRGPDGLWQIGEVLPPLAA